MSINRTEFTIKGDAPATRLMRRQIRLMAPSSAPVFISGESGSGKELAARNLHRLSSRAEGPFVAINCGAVPSALMESEFFGYTKGSFTGATRNRHGLFQAAHGGTLFLDEVTELTLPMQVKLLRVIQEKCCRPLGSVHETAIDVRLISASHRNLHEQLSRGDFREDLYFRINVMELAVPSLRQRRSDIPLLVASILDRLADNNAVYEQACTADAQALSALQAYDYPGNIRELENILLRASVMCSRQRITKSDLQFGGLCSAGNTSDNTSESSETRIAGPLPEGFQLKEYLQEVEKRCLETALNQTRWNRTAAARKLGVSFRTLRYRLKKLGIADL